MDQQLENIISIINTLQPPFKLEKMHVLEPTFKVLFHYLNWCMQENYQLMFDKTSPKFSPEIEPNYLTCIVLVRHLNRILKHFEIRLVPWDLIKPEQKAKAAIKLISAYIINFHDNKTECKENWEKLLNKAKQSELLKGELEKMNQQLHGLIAERDRIQTQLKEEQNEMEKIDFSLDVEKKRKVMIDKLAEQCKERSAEINRKKESITQLESRVKSQQATYDFLKQHNECEPKLKELQQRFDEISARNEELSDTVQMKKKDLAQDKSHLINLERYSNVVDELMSAIKRFNELEADNLAKKIEVENLDCRIASKKSVIDISAKNNPKQLAAIKSDINKIESDCEILKAELSDVSAKMKADQAAFNEVIKLKALILALYNDANKVRQEIAETSQLCFSEYRDILININKCNVFISDHLKDLDVEVDE